MKNVILAAVAAISLAACAQSIPETSVVDGRSTIMQIRATPNSEWEFLMDGQVVAKDAVALTFDNTLHGVYQGQPVAVRMYLRSNGWVAHKVADVFINGQLVETLIIS